MVQVKKDEVRNAIVDAAAALFEQKGFVDATISQIAKRANVSSASIYVYFPSKLDIAYAVFEPWVLHRLAVLEKKARRIGDERERLHFVLMQLWHDMALERNNYLKVFLQALAISPRDGGDHASFYFAIHEKVAALILSSLSDERREQVDIASLTHFIMMAFDGFVINGKVDPDVLRHRDIADVACDMILGRVSQASDAEASLTKPRRRAVA